LLCVRLPQQCRHSWMMVSCRFLLPCDDMRHAITIRVLNVIVLVFARPHAEGIDLNIILTSSGFGCPNALNQ
jgi:hypothetical protein